MTGNQRRQNILAELSEATAPVNATKLAEMNGVTRQIIVADIALLRAAGNNIRAEHKGYVIDKGMGEIKKKIVCKHSKEDTLEELYAVVDNGGKVLDVQVEHSIYGVLSGEMAIASRFDANEFVSETAKSDVAMLSDLTGGVHIHTISVKNEETFDRICARLKELGVLIQD